MKTKSHEESHHRDEPTSSGRARAEHPQPDVPEEMGIFTGGDETHQ